MAVFRRIGDDADDVGITSIDSLCMNCEKTGTTQLLLTVIPFFKEVVLMSFECPHCGYRNVEIQPGAAIQDRGCRQTLQVLTAKDMNRQVVVSESATIRVPDLQLEIPPSGNGRLTTVEGLLSKALEDLRESLSQGVLQGDEVRVTKMQSFLARLALYVAGQNFPFEVSVDDPSGNSCIENPALPKEDKQLKVEHYVRTDEQNKGLGLTPQWTEENDGSRPFVEPKGSVIQEKKVLGEERVSLEKEVFAIPAECPNCHFPGKSEMCIIDVPFFKEVIIMAFVCENCGFRDNEVKGGGAIGEKGQKMTLNVQPKEADPEAFKIDMNRDVVKSTSAGLIIPQLDLEVTPGSLGGMYTTVEGMLTTIRDKLENSDFAAFASGDSATPETHNKFDQFIEGFDRIIAGEEAFTFILDDPLANSFLYSPTAPEPEPRLTVEEYERTKEQEDQFGLSQMNTENYDTLNGSVTSENLYASARTEEEKAGIQSKMKDLQSGGKEAHPHANVVAKPDV